MAASGVGWGCETTNNLATAIHLTVETLLRLVPDLAGFVVKSVCHHSSSTKSRNEVELDADPRSKRRCSCCGKPGRVHDKLQQRRWHYVPLWYIPGELRYTPHRAVCPAYGAPTVEAMPWNRGESPYAEAYVRRSLAWVVHWGLENRDLSGVAAVGIDELHHGCGKKSLNLLTLVYQIDKGSRRVLWVGQPAPKSPCGKGSFTLRTFMLASTPVCASCVPTCGNPISRSLPIRVNLSRKSRFPLMLGGFFGRVSRVSVLDRSPRDSQSSGFRE